MQLDPVPSDVASAGLRALKTVCLANGELAALEVEFLDGIQRHVLGIELDIASLAPIAAGELVRAIPPGVFRERVLRGAVIAACIDGEVTTDEVEVIRGFADALEVDPAPVLVTARLAHQQLVRARLVIARRSLPGYKLRQMFESDGFLAVVKQFLPPLGIANEAIAAKYRTLADLPVGTLGRAYYDFVHGNGFPLPGEAGAAPEIIVLHDCIHVLGAYGSTPSEEILVAAFQAGCHYGDPLYGILFGLAQYHLGIQMAPVAPAESLHADPDLMIGAFVRGCRVSRDLWADFRPAEHFARPLDELRRELNIGPRV